MKSIGLFEAKTHFSALIQDAVNGKTTVITRRGKPVAEIRPIASDQRDRARQAVERLKALRSRLKGPPISARSLIDEGRR